MPIRNETNQVVAIPPGVSVLIPVFNSESTLNDVYNELVDELRPLRTEFEIIFIEDGSRDHSWQIIEELVNKDHRVRGIRLSRNYGQHNALLCGIRAACFDVIVTMDDDLQNPPSELKFLLAMLSEGHDVVYGVPEQEQHGLLRDIASQLTKWALRSAMGVDNARNVSAFRAFRTKLRGGFANFQSPFVSIDVLLTWATSDFAAIQVRHEPRHAGQSHYTIGKLVRHAFNLMTGFSSLPLQVASLIGFVFTLFGFCVLTWVLGRYLVSGTSVPGFPFLASIVAIFSGAQLFALGIFGEYLARIHFRTMNRPPYLVRDIHIAGCGG